MKLFFIIFFAIVSAVLFIVASPFILAGGGFMLGSLFLPDEESMRIARAENDISSFSSGLELYKLDNLNYPTTEQGLQALVTKPSKGPEPINWSQNGYIKRLQNDPWGKPYNFVNTDGEFVILSNGSDGVAGTSDDIRSR